jgi:serine O-acetyltransferase
MIQNLSDLFEYIEADRKSRRSKPFAKSFFLDPVFRFTVFLRINEYLQNTNRSLLIRLVPLLYFRKLSIRLGFSVPPNVFGPGLAIVHYGLLVVNPAARVGRNCRIHAGVNIGGSAGFVEPGDTRVKAPAIGHDCYIGPGAKIFGPVSIGDSCVIGANAVVNKSFEQDGVTIAGMPARIVSQTGSFGKVILGASQVGVGSGK